MWDDRKTALKPQFPSYKGHQSHIFVLELKIYFGNEFGVRRIDVELLIDCSNEGQAQSRPQRLHAGECQMTAFMSPNIEEIEDALFK